MPTPTSITGCVATAVRSWRQARYHEAASAAVLRTARPSAPGRGRVAANRASRGRAGTWGDRRSQPAKPCRPGRPGAACGQSRLPFPTACGQLRLPFPTAGGHLRLPGPRPPIRRFGLAADRRELSPPTGRRQARIKCPAQQAGANQANAQQALGCSSARFQARPARPAPTRFAVQPPLLRLPGAPCRPGFGFGR